MLFIEIPWIKWKTRNKKNPGKIPSDYRVLKRFDVVSVQGIEKLISPVLEDGNVRYYAKNTELFDILYEAHLEIGHKARDAMFKHVGKNTSTLRTTT